MTINFVVPLPFEMTDPLQLSPVVMIKRRWVHVVSALGLVIGSVVTSIAVTSPDSGRAAAAAALGAGGEYHPLAPARISTRGSGINDPTSPGAKALIPEPGRPSTSNCSARVACRRWPPRRRAGGRRQHHRRQPDRQGYLKVFGKGAPEGDSSLVNFKAGQNVPNLASCGPAPTASS